MSHPKQERTLLLIKPDGVKRGLVGDILTRIEKRGLKIVGLEMFWASTDQIDGHYPSDDGWKKKIGEKTADSYEKYGFDMQEELGTTDHVEVGNMVRKWLIDYMASGPIVKVVIEGINAIAMVRKISGMTLPSMANLGTIRGDYSVDDPTAANKDQRAVRNLVHASATKEEADHELKYWFSAEDVFEYKRAEEDVM